MLVLLAIGCRTGRSDRIASQQVIPAPAKTAGAAGGELTASSQGAASNIAAATPSDEPFAATTRLPPVADPPARYDVIPAGATIQTAGSDSKPAKPAVAATDPPPAASNAAASMTAERADLGLGLHQAIDLGLSQNPELVALRGTVNVSRAVAGVTKLYPWNPFVQSQFFPNGHGYTPSSNPAGAAGLSNYYVWAMQRFELAHQRRFRARIAEASVTQVHWNVQQGELLNVAQTTRVYFAALYQRELRDLALQMAELNEHLQQVVERRVQANLSSVADLTTISVTARQARRQADLADATYNAALMALRQQINVPLDQPLELDQRLTDFAWAPVPELEAADAAAGPCGSVQNLAASLIAARPDLMAAQAGVSVANANMLLSKAALVPDVAAGPIYETADDGTSYLGFRMQADIPVWNNGTPMLRQRRAELGQQQLNYGQLRERAMIDAQTAIDRYERDRHLVEKELARGNQSIAGGVPPEVAQIVAQFEAGQAEVLAVFTTQSSLLMDRRAWVDLLNETAQAAANVVQSAALPPQRLAIDRMAAPCGPQAEPVPPPAKETAGAKPPAAPATGGGPAPLLAPQSGPLPAPAAETGAPR